MEHRPNRMLAGQITRRTFLQAGATVGLSQNAVLTSAQSASLPVTIVLGASAPPLEDLAATELQKYLKALFGVKATIVSGSPSIKGRTFRLGSPQTNPSIDQAVWPELSDQGFLL